MAWSPLRLERLRCRCRIEGEARTPNGQGGFTTAWTKVADAWAEKIPLRGDEITRDSIARAVKSARFVTRPVNGITAEHRLIEVRDGTVWNIRRVDDPYGRGDRLEMDCETGVPA